MVPLQEIDVHTDRKAFFKLHIVSPTKAAPFIPEVLVYDQDFSPPYQMSVAFPQQFPTAPDAFEHALSWVITYCQRLSYKIIRINNPCNCEFLDHVPDQQAIVSRHGLAVQVEKNGQT